jgi:PST family polysaccharide transporter
MTLPSRREFSPESQPTSEQLRRSLVHGIAWTGGAKWLTQLFTWASTILVARVLGPDPYGLVAMAGVFLGLVTMFTEFGLGTSVVTLRDMTPNQIAQVNALAVLLGALGMAITWALAVPLAALYRTPELVWIIVALSTTFLISGVRVVPYALLQRDLRFRLLAILEGSQGLLYALANVAFALLGFGVWTLVLGAIASQLFLAVATVLACPHGYQRPRSGDLRGVLSFSGNILIGRFAWYIYSNADFFVAGRVLGKSALGAYSLAWTLASIPIEKITALVARVTPAYFAAARDDNGALRRILLDVTEGLAFLTLPATLGLALVAPEFVALFLGDQWSAVTVPLQILCLFASFRSLVTLLPQVLNVKGDAGWTMRLGVATALLLPPAFYAGSRWGAEGIAMVWVLVYPLLTIPLYRRTCQRIALPARAYWSVLWPALGGAVAMGAVVLLARMALPVGWPLAARLGVLVGAGAITYAMAAVWPQRTRLPRVVALLRQAPRGDPVVRP